MEITPESPEWGIRVTTAIHGVFSAKFPANKAQGLEASRWAPKQALPTPKGTSAAPSGSRGPGKGLAASRWAPQSQGAQKAVVAFPSPPSRTPSISSSSSVDSYHSAQSHISFSFSYSSPHHPPQLDSSPTSTPSSSCPSSKEVSNMYQAANLDDTAGFMAAARALAQSKQANASFKDKDDSNIAKGESKAPRRPLSLSASEFVPSSSSPVIETSSTQKKNGSSASLNFNPNAEEFLPSGANLAKKEIVNSAQGAGLVESDAKKMPASSNKIVNSAQGTGQNESDSKNKVTASSNDIVKSTQGTGLADSVAKNKVPVSGIKTTSSVDDTAGFMAAARARMNKPNEKNQVAAASSNKIVNSAQIAGLDESVAKNKATASGVKPVESVTKKEVAPSEVKPRSVDDTAGFMAAARARMHGSDTKPSNASVKSGTQDVGLVGSDANKAAASAIKTSNNVDDTAGFTAAARSRMHESDANKATASLNDTVKYTQDTGLVDSDAKNKVSASETKMTTDVNNTAGFMAAARAWKSRNISPVYTQAVVKTPDQLSDHMVHAQPSPVNEPFKSSTKVEKASNGNGISSGVQDSEPTHEKMPVTSTNKPANVDDAAGFMAAARALRSGNKLSIDTQAVAKTPDQTSSQMEQTLPSPTEGSFMTPMEKASSGNSISGGVLESEISNTVTFESTRERMSVASTNKPVNVDDAAGFMAAARALRPGKTPSSYAQAGAKTPGQVNNRTEQTQSPAKKTSTASPKTVSPKNAPPKKPANVDDSAGFMAAARALRSGNASPIAYAQNVEKTPGQQTQSPPAKEPSKSSVKVGKASNEKKVAGIDGAPGSEPTSEKESTAAPNKPSNVDDTAGFMAAARALKSRNVSPTASSQTTAKTPSQQTQSPPAKEPFKSSAKVEKTSSGNGTAGLGGAPGSKASNPVTDKSPREKVSTAVPNKSASSNSGSGSNASGAANVAAKKEATTDAAAGQALNTDSAKHPNTDKGAEAQQTGGSASSGKSENSQSKENTPADDIESEPEYVTYVCRDVYEPIPGKKGAMRHINQLEVVENVDEEEDRENMITFRSWGTPAPRNKPPAQVRRIILSGLPRAWANPSKALSLVHTGIIDKINMAPGGKAHIYFCDYKACNAFYDKHPNGIGIGSHNVFVERGKEIDVVSSLLGVNRSQGATRVLRVAGVNMDTTMTQLHQIASGQHRKVEKIVDSYSPGEARIVQFRFCSIEDAAHFRSKLIRDEVWKTYNIKYGKDPCEVDAGSHLD